MAAVEKVLLIRCSPFLRYCPTSKPCHPSGFERHVYSMFISRVWLCTREQLPVSRNRTDVDHVHNCTGRHRQIGEDQALAQSSPPSAGMKMENTIVRSEPCPDCGSEMLWTQNAWPAGSEQSAAYRCLNGHLLDPSTTRQCPACGVHDTTLVGSSGGRQEFRCERCGEAFTFPRTATAL